MITYQKVGGLHWIKIGRLRFAWCLKRKEINRLEPISKWIEPNRYKPLPRITDSDYATIEDMFH